MRPKPRSVLVLCVDRDNDVGEVVGVSTPLIGEEAVERAAVEFAMKRPEDSDANAIFAALKMYRELKAEGGFEEVEVALVAGHRDEGVKADMRIGEELDEILASRRFDAAILVSDGPTDELVLPILQSRVPVLSVQRVVVQQSRGVEESFLLILRYLRRLLEEEKYKKYSLGIPGALIALYIMLSILVPGYVWHLLLLVLGLSMLVKGFSLDEILRKIYRASPLLFASLVASLLLIALALMTGVNRVSELRSVGVFEALGYFLLASMGEQVLVLDLMVLSLSLPLAAEVLDAVFSDKQVGFSDYGALVLLLLFRQVLLEYSKVLVGTGSIFTLLYWIALTIVVLAVLAAVSTLMGKPSRSVHAEGGGP